MAPHGIMKVMPKNNKVKLPTLTIRPHKNKPRKNDKGLWKKDNPQAPWQFRRQNHEQQNGNKKQSDKQWFGIW